MLVTVSQAPTGSAVRHSQDRELCHTLSTTATVLYCPPLPLSTIVHHCTLLSITATIHYCPPLPLSNMYCPPLTVHCTVVHHCPTTTVHYCPLMSNSVHHCPTVSQERCSKVPTESSFLIKTVFAVFPNTVVTLANQQDQSEICI